MLRERTACHLLHACAATMAWIDTAFDGHLLFPLPLIQERELQSLVGAEAIA